MSRTASRRCHGGWAVVVVGLLLAGCAPTVVRPGWDPHTEVAALLAPAADPLAGIDSLLAEARVTVHQGRQRESGIALLRRCGRDLVRLDVRGPLSSQLFSALVEGDSLTLWGPAAGGAWKGSVQGPLLARMTGIDLAGYDPTRALLGTVLPASPERIGPPVPVGGELVEVEVAGPGPARRVWVDRRRGLIRREVVLGPDGRVRLDRRLADYRIVGSLLLPGRVEVRREDGVGLVFEYRRWAIGPVGEPDRLRRDLPRSGVRRVEPLADPAGDPAPD